MVKSVSDIIDAVWSNDRARIMESIEDGASLDEIHEGLSALSWAVDLELTDSIDLLIQLGANVNWRDSLGKTPLMRAASGGKLSIIKQLSAAGADIKAVDYEGADALQFAARRSSAECLSFLIGRGALVDRLDHNERDALYWALAWKNSGALRELINRGAPVYRTYEEEGFTALMLAVIVGSADCVRLVLEAGADPADAVSSGQTAADFVRADTPEIECLLTEANARREIGKGNKNSPA
jgi:ankyrin repeat protein